MKKTNAWRLPLAHSLRMAPIPSPTQLSNTGSLNDIIARTLGSPGLHQVKQNQDVGQVIASALSRAGLMAGTPSSATASFVGPGAIHAQGAPSAKRYPSGQSANEAFETGQFLDGSFCNAAGTRAYKLYVPSNHHAGEASLPLVVMLHGCTQSPDDFAIGTQMNRLAERDGFFVLYPAQSANANGSNCWNWFRSEDQQRGSGEPSLIAGLTRQIVSTYRLDPTRVFVAGLSAGAAMAVILGTTYPDVFAAVGAHSGLAYGAAHDVVSAFGAMKGGGMLAKGVHASGARSDKSTASRQTASSVPVPTIVFHGDHDHTVDAGNGVAIARQAIEAYGGAGSLRASGVERLSSGDRSCSRIVHSDAANRSVVEQWILHGAGHAWSGGNARGSYTDPCGPSASAEMIRFFHLHQRTGAT